MSMKSIFTDVINRGGFDLGGLLNRIDAYHIEGKLTDADRDELYAKARGSAKPENSVDVMAKLIELESRIAELEKQYVSGESGGSEPSAPAEYVPGRWYYNGDRVTFDGKVYTCTAPEGVVCTWSPYEYPAYWEAE